MIRRLAKTVKERWFTSDKSQTEKPAKRREMRFEAMEDRILLSADFGIDAQMAHIDSGLLANPESAIVEIDRQYEDARTAQTLTAADGEQKAGADSSTRDLAAGLSQPSVVNSVVIVDAAVPDYESLISDLTLQNANASHSESDMDLFVLNADEDGIAQISDILSAYQNIDEVLIFSHGSEGMLQLGSRRLNDAALNQNQDAISAWGNALSEDGDILLYGCNVAGGQAGVEFVGTLSRITGADVAASVDETGSGAKGGDWDLEYRTGMVESLSNASNPAPEGYGHLLEAIDGTGGNDVLTGNVDEDDTLTGGAGNDTYAFEDGWGTDTIVENSGQGIDTLDFSAVTTELVFTLHADGTVSVTDGENNVDNVANIENLIGGSEKNTFIFEDGATLSGTIDGGAGSGNVLNYANYTTGITVNLATGTATATAGISNIQKVIGGWEDDTFIGSTNDDWFEGGAGNDILTGAGGADVLAGDDGDDILYGDSGDDTLQGGEGDDTLYGGDGDDDLQGLSGDDVLYGGAGNDSLVGALGEDILRGGAGEDSLIGGADDDFLEGGADADTIDGGAGIDTLSYADDPGGVTVDLGKFNEVLGARTATDGWGNTDRINEIENVDGSAHDDILRGDGEENRLFGGGGDDLLEGRIGDDDLDGGDGTDTVTYAGEDAGVTADLAAGKATDGTGNTDTLTSIENLTGSDYDDTLTGDAGANVLAGGLGDDVLDGKGGANTYVFSDNWGDDDIIDTTGTAVLDFSNVTDDLIVTFSADGTVSVADGTNPLSLLSFIPEGILADFDGLSGVLNVENITTIMGGSGDNTFVFEDGAVFGGRLDGGFEGTNTLDYSDYTGTVSVDLTAGTATATGGIANITEVIRGSGNLELSGGDGGLTVSYAAADTGIEVDLIETTTQPVVIGMDTLDGVNHVIGSDYNDIISGNTNSNSLDGGAGADVLDGGAGEDTYHFSDGWGVDTILDETGEGSILDFSGVSTNLIFTIHADGSISVTDGANHLHAVQNIAAIIGGSGINTFVFADGASFDGTIDGGAGTLNTLDYSAYTTAVNVDLSEETATGTTGVSNISKAIGGAGADTLIGDDEDNVFVGGAGEDIIDGGGGRDTASYETDPNGVAVTLGGTATDGYGDADTLTSVENLAGSAYDDVLTGDGEDNVLIGNAGDDTLTGGEGADTVSYANDPDGVEVTLGEDPDAGTGADGYGGIDTLNGIENVSGSAYDDILTGNSSDNVLSGEAGDDVIQGLGGDDTLTGGDGTDTASYADSDTGVTVDLSTTDAQDTVGAGSDTITEIETLMGSGHDDTLKGNADGNTIISSGGTDTLEGTEGPDRYMFYQGQWGNETIIEEAKGTSLLDLVDDVIGTDLAGDTDDSASVDILDFSNVSDDLTFLFNADGTVTITDGVNTLSNIANIESIIGGSGTNTFVFADGASFDGTIDGGAGELNVLDYSNYTTAVAVVLAAAGDTALGTATGTNGVANIQKVIGGSAADEITGDENDNILMGGGGDDVLTGGDGSDTLYGGAGNDTLEGGAGNDLIQGNAGDDVLDGGEGDDTVSYADVADNGTSMGVTVNLSQSEQDTQRAGIDTLTDVENIEGSDFNDTLIGDENDNLLRGGAGNDVLYGGEGADILAGGLGDDYLEGGAGSDTAAYDDIENDTQTGVDVDLGSILFFQDTGGAGTDSFGSIENLVGSQYDDTLAGDSSDNVIIGGGGDDTIDGGAGADILSGGEGADIIYGGTGNDAIDGGQGDDALYGNAGDDVLSGSTGADVLDGGSGEDTASYAGDAAGVLVNLEDGNAVDGGGDADTLTGISHLIGSDYDDTLIGDTGDNLLAGGAGDDILEGGAGDDRLEGGDGTDIASFENDLSGVNADISTGSATDGFGGSDTLYDMEGLSGSAFDDTLTGDVNDNILMGNAGDDTLMAGDGDDILEGGAGDDTLEGGRGSDTASYAGDASGVDVTLGGSAFDGFGSSDTLTDIENLTGSDHADTLTGDENDNILAGGAGDDTLTGGAGDDTLMGGAGDDILEGGEGSDTASYVDVADDGTDIGVTVSLDDTGRPRYGAGRDRQLWQH